MAPINWEIVGAVGRDGAQDEDSVEEVINILRHVNEEDFREDSEKLILLFLSAKKALDYREHVFNEIMQDHEVEVDDLKRELEEQTQLGSGAIPRDAEYYRSENRRFAEQKAALQEQNEQLNEEISQIVDEKSKLEQEAEGLRKMNKDLKMENQDLRMNLLDYQNIIDKQAVQKDVVGGDLDVQAKLTERNKQVAELLNQITDMERANRALEEGTRKLKQEMESGQEDMEKITEEYEKMRKVVHGSDKFSDDLQKQNAQLNLKVADLLDQIKERNYEDDAISNAVNKKVEEWASRVQLKDAENVEQARIIADLKAKIASAALGQDRMQLEKMIKKLEAREMEVAQLKTTLNQAVAEIEEQTAIVEDLRQGQGTNKEMLAYKAQIRNLQMQNQKNETAMRESQKKCDVAEDDARETEVKLTEAVKRITLLESGQYGLTEAVAEIKDCRGIIRRRDKEIRDLTQGMNQLEEKLNDFIEENEEFRERLGIDSRNLDDIVELRKNRALRQQQFRAENQILLKEIEMLEEERIMLKKQIRREAQSQLQRAADEGLQHDDLVLIDDFIDEVIRMRKQGYEDKKFIVRGSLSPIDKSDKRSKYLEADKFEKLLRIEQSETKKLKQESHGMMTENENLKRALVEALTKLKSSGKNELKHVPALDKLLEILGGKKHVHTSGNGVERSDFDQLYGKNEELRSELKKMRQELVATLVENKALEKHNEELKEKLESLVKLTKKHINMNGISLHENVNPQARDVINALNEQVIEVLEERNLNLKKNNSWNQVLETSKRQLQVIRHQAFLLYEEYHGHKEKSAQEKILWENEKNKMEGKLEKNAVKIEEFERLLSALEADPNEMKQKLAETSRKISLLRVNEKTLIRKHKSLEASEDMLTLDNQRLKREIQLIEKRVAERISYLERYKIKAKYKLDSLQKSLEESVPESDLRTVNRRYDELTVNYREMLQKSNQFVAENTKLDMLQEEFKIANDRNDSLCSQLSIEKEKRHAMEEALRKSNVLLDVDNPDASLFRKVTVLEMKELNERQKAKHATIMYNRVKSAMEEVQKRNEEVEKKFSELTRLNLAAQQTERELRDELADAVPRNVYESERKKMRTLEGKFVKAKDKMKQLQDLTDVAQSQLSNIQSQQQAKDRETKCLKLQLREFEAQSDEHALIGKLHHQILSLQAKEGDAQKKLSRVEKNVLKLESYVLKLQNQLDEKDDSIYLIRVEFATKAKQLRKTIQNLRHQFSGALPLVQQEKFSHAIHRMQRDKVLIQEELKRLRAEREKMEDKVAEVEIKQINLNELKKAIEDGRGADKLTEWSQRMDKLRLQDMKLQRQVLRQSEQLKYLENVNNEHEKTICELEEDIVQLLKAQEEHQVEWEIREMELERLLDQFQLNQRDFTRRAKRIDEITQYLPDPSLSPDEQLTQALDSIRTQSKAMAELQGHLKALEFENDRLKNMRHTLEGDVASRDRVINELRLVMPNTTSSASTGFNPKAAGSDQQLRLAVETIDTLKKRLATKEESLLRHKQLLNDTRKSQEVAASNQEHDMLKMQQKLHRRSDEAFSRFKENFSTLMKPEVLPPRVMAYINELEEMIKEQDAALAALMERVHVANADLVKQKQVVSSSQLRCEMERKKLSDDHEAAMASFRLQLAKRNQMVDGLEKELLIAKKQLEEHRKQSTRTPLPTMKNLVKRLKSQLQEKEKQQQQLSYALTELRADLVEQAQENIRNQNINDVDANNVKSLMEKKTIDYKTEIHTLKDELAEFQRRLKESKRNEDNLRSELKVVLEENERKELSIKKPSSTGSKIAPSSKETEIARLKNEVVTLKEENKLLNEKFSKQPTSKSLEEVAKWNASKTWQKKVEQVNHKLQEKEKLLEVHHKQIVSLKETVSRLEKEKLQRPVSASRSLTHTRGTRQIAEHEATKQHLSKIEELYRSLQQLEKENQKFRHSTVLPQNKRVLELEENNRFLREKLHDFEEDFSKPEASKLAKQFQSRENQLQDRILKLKSENAQLLFEINEIKLDVPKIKERLNYQEKYIDLLQNEKRKAEDQNSEVKVQSKTKSVVEKGSSGKSVVSLEKSVALMKRLVERVQRENDELKKAPGVVSSQKLEDLKSENQLLKDRLNNITQQVGGRLSKRYEVKTQTIEKLVAEIDRLKSEMNKQVASEKSKKDMETVQAAKIVQLETKLQATKEEKQSVVTELKTAQEKLAHFDEDFFDEIEDLKYNYTESMKKNVMYEEQLRSLSAQFGVQVDIPPTESE